MSGALPVVGRGPLVRRSVLAWALAGLAGLAALIVLRAWTPSGISTCLSATLLGVNCPGCGMTRACSLLARGDLAGSIAMHPLALFFAVQALVAWTWWGLVLARRVRVPSPWWGIGALTLNTAALVVTWLARMATGTLPG